MSKFRERIQFRLISMPCCQHQLCWVNPRLPSYCPSCGHSCYPEARSASVIVDDNAWLSYDAEKPLSPSEIAKREADAGRTGFPRRFHDALLISEGAVNPSGMARSLVAACKECIDANISQREDPAVRLITYQLAFIVCGREPNVDLLEYGKWLEQCRQAVSNG